MTKRNCRSSLRALLLPMLFVVGCNDSQDTSNVATSDGEKLAPVTLALNWLPDSQHGGFFAAQVHGFFAEQRLDVTISPGGPNAPVAQKVALNQAQFGVGNSDQLLMARQQEMDVVAVFAAMQNSPRCIMVHSETGITRLADLKDVTLAVGAGKAFVEFMKRSLPLDGVTTVPYTGSIAPFLNDQNFAQQAYVFSEPHVAKSRGANVHSMMVSELGFNPYSSCLFVNGKVLRNDPTLVKKMVAAVRKGWQQYLADPYETNLAIQRANPEMNTESLQYGAEAIRQLCVPGDDVGSVGQMNDTRWQTIAKQLAELGFLNDASQYSAAFTTRFLSVD
ncbi:MAG: ABC transporter substrate-binding protein [Planctomycetales bacterium]|nr:ABC transporter substrate-binding protein [Planctomycetales bacterium]